MILTSKLQVKKVQFSRQIMKKNYNINLLLELRIELLIFKTTVSLRSIYAHLEN